MSRGTRLSNSRLGSNKRSAGRNESQLPVLRRDYNFLKGSLDPNITFSRSSSATQRNKEGKICYAPNNVLTSSEDIVNDWTIRGSVSVTPEQSDPDGGTTAYLFDGVIGAGLGDVYQSVTSLPANAPCVVSFYIKKVTSTGTLYINNPQTAGAGQWSVDLSKIGTAWERITESHAAVTVMSSHKVYTNGGGGIHVYSGGDLDFYFWHPQIELSFSSSDAANDYISTGSGSAVHKERFDYDHAASLSTDITESNRLGLLVEEQKTNLQANSSLWVVATHAINNFNAITNNFAISPSGARDAWRGECYDTGGAARHEFYTRYNKADATQYTHSLYIKPFGTVTHLKGSDEGSASRGACFDLINCQVVEQNMTNQGATIEKVTEDGWVRVSFTFTSVAANTDSYLYWAVGDEASLVSGSSIFANYNPGKGQGIYCWGVQTEVQNVSSYIPTYGSTSVRSGDSAVVSGTNFSRFYKDGKGESWIVEAEDYEVQRSTGQQAAVIKVHEGGNNFLGFGKGFGGGVLNRPAVWYKDGVAGGDMIYNSNFGNQQQTIDKNASYKLGVALDVDNAAWIMNGHLLGAAQKDTSVPSLYSPTEVRLGTSASHEYNGHIRRVRYYNKRISDAQLVKKTNTDFLLNKYQHVKAAHSLRQLKEENTNSPVCSVRRSYDSAESSYTAAQVSNGDLEKDFRSADQTTLPLDVSVEADEMIVGGDFTDLVTNGDFATDSDWTKGTGWTIGSGVASCDGSQSDWSILRQDNILPSVGSKVTVTLTVSGYSAGTLYIKAGDGDAGFAITANGTYTTTRTVTGADQFRIQGDTNFVGSVDNVSVIEGSWTLGTHFRPSGNQIERFAGGSGENSAFTQIIPVRKGRTYKVEYDVIHTSGNNYTNVYINPGNGYITTNQLFGSGHSSDTFTALTTGNLTMQFYGISDFRGFWDNVTVKEVNPIGTGFSTRLINSDYKGKPLMRIRSQSNVEAELYADENDEISLSSSIKGSSQNLLGFSEDFGSLQAVPTTLKGGQADPFGGNNAYEIIGNATHATATVESGTSTLSIYAKRGTADFLVIRTMNWDSGASARTWFNLHTGAVGSTDGGTAHVGATIEAVTGYDGWYRCAVTFSTTSDLGGTSEFYSAETDSGAESSSKSIIATGMQLEKTLYASSGSDIAVNGGFEVDANWTDFGSPVTQNQSTEVVRTGTYSRKVVSSANTKGIQSHTHYSITAGRKYRVSAWIYAVDGGSDAGVKSGLGNTDQGVFTNRPVTEGQWTNITYDAIALSTVQAGTYLSFLTNGDTTTFYVDDLTITELPVESPSTYSQTPVKVLTHHNTTAQTLGEFSGLENLLTYSEQFSSWTAYNSVRTADTSVTDPFGGTSAYKLNETAATEFQFVHLNPVMGASKHTFSAYLKAGERTTASLMLTQSGNFGAVFDLSAGTLTSVNGTGNTAAIEAVGNEGWYRCSITNDGSADIYDTLRIGPRGGAMGSITGEANKGIYIFGAQLNTNSLKTYQATTGTALTGDVNVVNWYSQSYGEDAIQDTATDQPFIVLGSELCTDNGKACVQFTGTQFLELGDLSGMGVGHIFSILSSKYDPPDGGTTQGIGRIWEFGSTGNNSHHPHSSGTIFHSFGSTVRRSTGTTPEDYTKPHLVSIKSKTGDWNMRFNGNSKISSTTNTVGFATACFLGDPNGSTPWTGKYSEVVLFPADMDTKRFPIEQNMLNHFDVNLVDLDFENFTASELGDNSVMGPSGNSTIGTATLSAETANPISGTQSMKIVTTSGNNGSYPRFYLASKGRLAVDPQIGEKYRLTFDTKLISGNITINNISFRDGSDSPPAFLKFSDDELVLTTETQTHTYETTITDTSSITKSVFWSVKGTTSAGTFLIDNIKIEKIGEAGYLTKLFDQSGNNCHALQATAANQPQIVSGGDLIKSGNHPAWEHTDQSNLELHGKIQAAHLDAWFVHDTSDDTFLYPSNGSDYGGDFGWVAQTHTSVSGTGDYGGSSAKLYVNGTLIGASGSMNRTVIKTALTGRKLAHHQDSDTADWQSLQMGLYTSYGNGYCYQGKFSEWIWYDSDQSSNKTGIESNINTHYNIY